MEYTDAPSAERTTESTEPLSASKPEGAEGQASDAIAVLLSMVPGLGHIYKGHNFIGMLLIFAGTPMAVGIALLIATGTAGFGIGLLPIYWAAVMFHVYGIEDRAASAAAASIDDGEQY
ncbi:hypothetical protein BH18VER1_BH18VER1_16830 [soil metagenome]